MRAAIRIYLLHAVLGGVALAADSRVIVSATLNDTLEFFDAATLEEVQPPLASKGGGPIRLWVDAFDGHPYLFAANHGVVNGSVGVFDLSGDLVSELPLSPFPSRAGSVGIAAGTMRVGGVEAPMVFVTNTYSAVLAVAGLGCSLPNGSMTAFDASLLTTAGLLQEIGTVDLSGAVPYAVSADRDDGLAFATSNCTDTLDTITLGRNEAVPADTPLAGRFTLARSATRATEASPDGTIFDTVGGHNFTVNISGGSVSVHDAATAAALTTVPLGGGAHPIDVTLADSRRGRRWLVTSNGSGNSVSLVDRDVIQTCIWHRQASCPQAEVLQVPTKPGGEPEGVAYDPATNRIFAVNKYPIGSPSLSVVQIDEGATLAGSEIDQVPLGAIGASAPIPALIAFDVVVQVR